ncbi:MAG: carboxypeptidase regulatory-like domain-containing protein [Euryarchaeota archaeon]|nr:carboxypeptidase regulatory-like domain-containing protein [Euryarchaeota archaeon]
MRTVAVLAAFSLVFSGCVAGGTKGQAPEATSEGSLIVVDEASGQAIALEKGKGAVAGLIRDDIGVPVATAHVALLHTDFSAYSNRTGKFQVLNVTAGAYVVRIDHPDYRAAEEPIEVVAGKVLNLQITLLPKTDAGAGYRAHLHDYWGDSTEVVVIAKDFDWHEPYDKNRPYAGYEQVNRYYNFATQAGGVNPCLYQGEVYFNNRHVWFDNREQLVWARDPRRTTTSRRRSRAARRSWRT